jgi:uncharacterized protein with von Willebrand factor type A (vWA) domain
MSGSDSVQRPVLVADGREQTKSFARRAKLLVWLNPRAAHSEYQPLAGSMAAALPHCDLFLPANSLTGLRELLLALAAWESTRSTARVR